MTEKIIEFIGKAKFLGNGDGYIWGEKENEGLQMIGEVRGWGAIQNLFKNKKGEVDFQAAAKFQDELGHFIAASINRMIEMQQTKGKQ